MSQSLQEMYAPKSICFGCGPANTQGLQIRSFQEGGIWIARFWPETHHQAFVGVLNGGIVGALLDCHSNWAAAIHLMQERRESIPPCTVTAEYAVQLLRPTPMDTELLLTAQILESSSKKAVVESWIEAKKEKTAYLKGTFVAVSEGHPAFHRW